MSSDRTRARRPDAGTAVGEGAQAPDPAGCAVLGLACDRPADPLAPLLTALSRWCSVRSLPTRATAWIADSAGLARHRERLAGRPLALWWAGPAPGPPAPLGALGVDSARVVLTADPATMRAAGTRALRIPADGPGRDARYMPPMVRARLRRARGLPANPVLDCGPTGWRWPARPGPLPESLHATALACAAVAVVSDAPTLTLALSWGTPAVATADVARELEATAGVHLLDGDTPRERQGNARLLAEDPRLAARLSWAGRLLWEERHDVERAACTLAATLLPAGPRGHQLRLAELGTPAGAHVRSRIAAAVESLPGAS
jgi:hypothetical protein